MTLVQEFERLKRNDYYNSPRIRDTSLASSRVPIRTGADPGVRASKRKFINTGARSL